MGKLFSEIIGQDAATKILRSQLEQGTFSHAYLFLGSAGSGKEYLARKFAKYILCDNSSDDDCPSCIKYEHGAHPDFVIIDGRDGIKIEEIRKAIKGVNLSAGYSKKKVLLLTEAENIGQEAANALLKTLEEPPLDSVIIIISQSEKALPETIVSRCQKIKVQPVSKKSIVKILSEEFGEEAVSSVIGYAGNNLDEVRQLLGDKELLANKKDMIADVEIFLNSNSVIEKFKVIEKYDKTKDLELRDFFDTLVVAVFTALGADIRGKDLAEDLLIESNASPLVLSVTAAKILKIIRDLDYNINLKIALEEIVLENSFN